ncbi:RNA-guided endonuclease InsQ/TnpB family protein [Rothia sp. L_38]|uniref:RNA-guided endonuclease InsQ/TnpB family protein n=1 Tax=Rothia sp. L_38 TaxID=3422315 RepID=UPI003D6C1FDB
MSKRGYKTRIYPTSGQEQDLARVFGCVRFIFNQYTAYRDYEYENQVLQRKTHSQLRSILTVSNKKTAFPWLTQAPAAALQESCAQAKDAYAAMVKKRAAGKKARTPRRTRKGVQSFRLPGANSFKVKVYDAKHGKFKLYIPKVGWVKGKAGRNVENATSLTISKDSTGKYWASFILEAQHHTATPAQAASIDLGLTHLATITTTSGQRYRIDTPQFYQKNQRKLTRAQRKFARTKKGSNNRTKAAIAVAKIHQKIRNQRNDYLHQLTSTITRENQTVAVETLNITGLSRTRLGKSINNAAWAMLVSMLEYKLATAGGRLIKIDRFAPTTQTCSVCGAPGGKKALNIRAWQCQECETWLDRDYNAAVNIMLAAGLAESLNACGEDVRRQLAGAVLV